jgi:hypothetical protein
MRILGMVGLIGGFSVLASCGEAEAPERTGQAEFASTTYSTENVCATGDPADYDLKPLNSGTVTDWVYGTLCADYNTVDWTISGGHMRFTATWTGTLPNNFSDCVASSVKLRVNPGYDTGQPVHQTYVSPTNNTVVVTGNWSFFPAGCSFPTATIDEPTANAWDGYLWVRSQAWAHDHNGNEVEVTQDGFTF